MTDRGRIVLALGGATYVAAWAFGSKPLYPVATGLLLAVVLAWGWVRLANRPMRLRRSLGEREVPTTRVGDFVMRELAKLDKIAYIRFASVYRSFESPDDFREAVQEVKSGRRKRK